MKGNSVYINGIGSIAAQKTFDNAEFLNTIEAHVETVLPAVNPNYKDYIPPASARRMAKGIKMGIVTSKLALADADLDTVDAIITGTGMGCLRDSEKFLSSILDHDEQFLTPTPFIQSTHNTVGGQIALNLQCKGYNFTYVHSSVSFESAVLDAKLQLQLDEANTILVGGVDELADHTVNIHRLINHVKAEPVDVFKLLEAKTKGAVFSEGANFFVLSTTQQASTYAEIVDVKLFNTLPKDQVLHSALSFLKDNDCALDTVDALVLGYNGDVDFDGYYDVLAQASEFNDAQHIYYKHLSGEFNTASSFGCWLSSKIIKNQDCPDVVKLNQADKSTFNTILLYNQYRGENHSFTLLRKC